MPDTADYTLSDAPWAVLLAAGQGTRLMQAAGMPKQFLRTEGVPLFWLSARAFRLVPRLSGIVFVFPPDRLGECEKMVRELSAAEPLGLAIRCAAGGERRQASVFNGLLAVPEKARFVLVHDSARPFFSPGLAGRVLSALEAGAQAAIPGIPVKDTIKKVQNGIVVDTLPRAELMAVQTPQGFDRAALLRAHRDWQKAGDGLVTDDAALMEAAGASVRIVEGEEGNMKITTPGDLGLLSGKQDGMPCTGFGYDVHRYGGTRPLVLGGVPMEGGYTVEAHSDGDVLLHALMDALLGLSGKGDIGELFPDSDPAFDGISSAGLLSRVLDVIRESGIVLTNIDCTVVCQKPKVGPQRGAIRHNLCRLLSLDPDQVSVKATTEEKLGFTGDLSGIKAYAVATGLRTQRS